MSAHNLWRCVNLEGWSWWFYLHRGSTKSSFRLVVLPRRNNNLIYILILVSLFIILQYATMAVKGRKIIHPIRHHECNIGRHLHVPNWQQRSHVHLHPLGNLVFLAQGLNKLNYSSLHILMLLQIMHAPIDIQIVMHITLLPFVDEQCYMNTKGTSHMTSNQGNLTSHFNSSTNNNICHSR